MSGQSINDGIVLNWQGKLLLKFWPTFQLSVVTTERQIQYLVSDQLNAMKS